MTKIKEDIVCENCEAEFRIEYNEGEHLSVCPFCGVGLEPHWGDDEPGWVDLDSLEE